MKVLFSIIAVCLVLGYIALIDSFPTQRSVVPLLYWSTDPAPSRSTQIKAFEQWQIDHGYTTKDGKPAVRVEVDANSSDQSKNLIQGVSGVASDLIDVRTALGQLGLYRQSGILEDVTDLARERGFSPAKTWKAIRPEITANGRQYMFPDNVAVRMLWVNKDAFAKAGVPEPPTRWRFQQFEQLGRRFVEAANRGKARQTVFFADDIPRQLMYRSLGLSQYNETLTACDLNDPRYVRVLKLKHKWIYQDHLLPTPGQQQSMQSQAGFGGAGPQMFVKGRYAMFYSGRYMVMQFRQMQEPRLDVVEVPNGGFANALTTTRAAAVYTGSAHTKLAALFLQYLASQRYNMQIVEDGDALPPVPKYTQTEAFLRPPKYPNEWGCAGKFVEEMRSTAIGSATSPFLLQTSAMRIIQNWQDEFDNDLVSAEQAARSTAEQINQRIARNVARKKELQPLYQKRIELQRKIDARLKAGRKLPAKWVLNPFYRRYYKSRGMLENSQGRSMTGADR